MLGEGGWLAQLGRVPASLWTFLVGSVVLTVLLAMRVNPHASVRWSGVVVEAAAIVGMFRGSNLCRWVLIALGLVTAFGMLLVQGGQWHAAAVSLSVGMLLVTGLLVAPSSRIYTHGPGPLRRNPDD